MKKICLFLIVGIWMFIVGCSNGQNSWFSSDEVGRYQIVHYTTQEAPYTEFFLRLDTITGRTELFSQTGGNMKYMDSFFSPEIEGKQSLK
jgi:hypothetical protein